MATQYLHIDYATLRFSSLRELLEIIGDELTPEPAEPAYMHGYDSLRRLPFGGRIYLSGATPSVLVQLPGAFCVGLTGLLYRLLFAAERCSRIDIAADNELGTVLPDLIEGARAGRVVGIRSWRVLESNSGRTVYLGSRQSAVFVRCYDRRGVDRCEVEVKGEGANLAVKLLKAGSNLGEIMAGALAKINLVISGGVNRARAAVVESWAAFKMKLGTARAKVRPSAKVTTAAGTLQWLRGSVASSLCTLFEVCGPDLLSQLLAAPRDPRKVDRFTKELQAIGPKSFGLAV